MTIKTFKAGSKYSCRSVYDRNCVWTFLVTKRTAKSIWLEDVDGAIESKRYVVKEDYRVETEMVLPLGRYSMAPILRADREAV
jgi:hypothetical protein